MIMPSLIINTVVPTVGLVVFTVGATMLSYDGVNGTPHSFFINTRKG
jgi:hypothetical protein